MALAHVHGQPYRRVFVKIIFWADDKAEIIQHARDLAQAFIHFDYEVEELVLPCAKLEDSISRKPGDLCSEDLQIWCYIGGTRVTGWQNIGLALVPYRSMLPDAKDLNDPRAVPSNWLSEIMSPSQCLDTLIILDCYLGRNYQLQNFLRWPIQTIHKNSMFRFEVLYPCYISAKVVPGHYFNCLSELLKYDAHITQTRVFEPEWQTPLHGWDVLVQKLKTIKNHSYSSEGIMFLRSTSSQTLRQLMLLSTGSIEEAIYEEGNLKVVVQDAVHHVKRLLEFIIQAVIHEDGITKVLKAKLNGTTTTCALKVLKSRNKHQTRSIARLFNRELKTLENVSSQKHPHILDFLAAFTVPTEPPFGQHCLVFPFADGGSVYDFLRLPEAPAWLSIRNKDHSLIQYIYTQVTGITDAIAFIHSKKSGPNYLLHCDIKPSNILIQDGVFKIADFGLSRLKMSEETSKTEWYFGTPLYAPPERLAGDDGKHGRARDMWALGCVILEILVLLFMGFSKPPQVEIFEEERLLSSGEHESMAFARTMECVQEWIRRLYPLIRTTTSGSERKTHREVLQKMIKVMGAMLLTDPLERMTSAEARDCLLNSKSSQCEQDILDSRVHQKRGDPFWWFPADGGSLHNFNPA